MKPVDTVFSTVMGTSIALLLLAVLAACNNIDKPTPNPNPPVAVPKPIPDDEKDRNAELEALHLLAELHNSERSKAGMQPLTPHIKLMAAAKYHANWMAANKKVTHEADGTTPWHRIGATGYSYSAAGENIAYGYRGPGSVMAGWMGSRGHRANILNRNYTEFGLAVTMDSAGVPYWCTVFARPKSVGAAVHPDVEIEDYRGFNNK
jgi:uncharacterized protein YkwD